MCGVSALIRTVPGTGSIVKMTDAVQHRGPDGSGIVYLTREGREVSATEPWSVALGHRRLSIIDVSEDGRQPMCRAGVWLVYNGEVYNYIELRRELESGHEFTSHSDTEVILAAYLRWGRDCFARLRGMWGLVLFDSRQGHVVLSRDRLGIKPLYVANTSDGLAVVSEPKQLAEAAGFRLQPETSAVEEYLLTGYEDQSRTFFRGVRALTPGTHASLELGEQRELEPRPYWFPERITPVVSDVREATRIFGERFEDAVRVHLRSDVPVGCALSGGLDSSAIAATIAGFGGHELRTFSVVFPNFPCDERRYIDAVVDATGATPAYVTPDPDEFVAEFDEFVWHHDEPVGSLSQYAGYAVARLARRGGVPVTLNGQGGDEAFSAYWQLYWARLLGRLRAGSLLEVGAELIGAAAPGGNRELLAQAPAMARRFWARRAGGEALRLVADRPKRSGRAARILGMSESERRVFEVRELMLPRLLRWDDRNFMAFSVEGRYPFLDHHVLEACFSFRSSALSRAGWSKEPLRRVMQGRLPPLVARRRTKVGFETPQDAWLTTSFRPLVERVFSKDSPVFCYVDALSARALAARVTTARAPERAEHEAVFRVLCLDRWLSRFGLEPGLAESA